ncbi:hypothetical protein KIPB_014254, partial [Kipferlia bialata]
LRDRKAFADSIPQGNDPDTVRQRLAMLVELDLQDWKAREIEIKEQDEVRLNALATLLADRERERERRREDLMSSIRAQRSHAKERSLRDIQKNRVLALRRLAHKVRLGEVSQPSTSVTPSSLVAAARKDEGGYRYKGVIALPGTLLTLADVEDLTASLPLGPTRHLSESGARGDTMSGALAAVLKPSTRASRRGYSSRGRVGTVVSVYTTYTSS